MYRMYSPNILAYMREPTSIIITENTFSIFVVGATLPNPTDVREENVKYNAVT